jgi:hypothetical protein
MRKKSGYQIDLIPQPYNFGMDDPKPLEKALKGSELTGNLKSHNKRN